MTALMIASTWDLDAFEDSCHLQYAKKQIASTWDLDTFEGYGGWVKDDFMFINLGSGELRGLVCRADHSLGHCISWRIGPMPRRGLALRMCCHDARLYQPGNCQDEDSFISLEAVTSLYQPGICPPSRTTGSCTPAARSLYQPGICLPSKTDKY